jgi:hypothetical protein
MLSYIKIERCLLHASDAMARAAAGFAGRYPRPV